MYKKGSRRQNRSREELGRVAQCRIPHLFYSQHNRGTHLVFHEVTDKRWSSVLHFCGVDSSHCYQSPSHFGEHDADSITRMHINHACLTLLNVSPRFMGAEACSISPPSLKFSTEASFKLLRESRKPRACCWMLKAAIAVRNRNQSCETDAQYIGLSLRIGGFGGSRTCEVNGLSSQAFKGPAIVDMVLI